MNNLSRNTLVLLFMLILFQCGERSRDKMEQLQTDVQNNYLKLYSGAYNIAPDGAEAFALREDGTCSWIYGWMSNGTVQTQQKQGTWTASESSIKISINGNTGTIVEVYTLQNGQFVNVENASRYLIKR